MCTRVIYTPNEGQNYVARNMDFHFLPLPNIWALPNNMQRDSCVSIPGKENFTWTSKYSSIVVTNFDGVPGVKGGAVSDGLNSKGLTVNLLWLTLSEFPTRESQEAKDLSAMALSVWAQYILDIAENVEEAILAMDKIYIVTAKVPGEDKFANCHLSVGDKDGNSAVFEYINGELIISTNVKTESTHTLNLYTRDQMTIMTNDPEFKKQVDSVTYWEELNLKYASANLPPRLPGSSLPLDRFARASYYAQQLPQGADEITALSELYAVINNAAQPTIQIGGPGSPGISKTQYTSITKYSSVAGGDLKLQYFYRSGFSPFFVWLNLNDIPFSDLAEGEAFKLPLNQKGVFADSSDANNYISGNVDKYLQKNPMFKFMSI